MTRRLIVPVLMLAAACSSPLHETAEPAQPAAEPVAAERPSVAPASAPAAQAPAPAARNDSAVASPEAGAQLVAAVAAPAEKPSPPHALVTPDPLKEIFDEEARRVEHEKLIVRLAGDRDAAAAVVARHERDLLAFKNPFLPRPQLTPEESAEIKGQGGAARAKWAEGRVAEAKALLDAAQKAYDDAVANR